MTDQLDTQEKTLVHNVAQFVHCFAQGKVGSGFDVSSAVWGSHRYKRFNPAILTPIMVSKKKGENCVVVNELGSLNSTPFFLSFYHQDENVDAKVLSKALDADNKR